MMEKLKPCPFCGGIVEISQAGEALDTFWYYIHHWKEPNQCRIFMESELCNKYFPDEARAMKRNLIEAWNRRAKE